MDSLGIPTEEQIPLFKQIGFEGFFTGWKHDEMADYRRIADEEGMIYQSVHAPFGGVDKLWKEDREAAQMMVSSLISCAEDCSKYEVPIMICHVWIGFDTLDVPNSAGVENFCKVVEAAQRLGVKIAFENTEGEEFLEMLMSALKDYSNVGFCFDSGHEMCYNHSKDMLKKYGDRLIATHINDNLGIKRFDGKTYWLDDLHLLPFDGIGDWEGVAKRIVDCRYDGVLTFELSKKSKPHRQDNDKYEKMSAEEYLTEAYARACRVAALVQKHKGDN